MDARIPDGCDCDGDFEFTDVIFTIFWMPLAWRPWLEMRDEAWQTWMRGFSTDAIVMEILNLQT